MVTTIIIVFFVGASLLMLKKYHWSKVFYTRESLVAALRREWAEDVS